MPHTASTRIFIATALVVSVASAAAPTHADLNFLTAPAPGGFVQACAGPATSGGNWPGADFFPHFFSGSGADLVEAPFVGESSADVDAAFSNGTLSNSADAAAGLGFIQMSTSNSAPNSAQFPMAVANGGWSETFVIANPSLTGQDGFMQFTLDVHGTLFASGFAGSAVFTVTGYKDNFQLFANPLFDPGNSTLLGTDRQYGNWAIATYGNPPTESLTVDDTVTFAVPFTFGTPFKLGIYAAARAGMRSQSSVIGLSTAESHFDEGLSWGGITQIYHGMTPITAYTVTSGSGIDWSQAGTPTNPADFNGDGVVNSADLATLLGAWGTAGGDLNGDGTTNATDLAILLSAWS